MNQHNHDATTAGLEKAFSFILGFLSNEICYNNLHYIHLRNLIWLHVNDTVKNY